MKPTDQTRAHVIATYVNPARLKKESVIKVRVGTVQKELGWTNRTPSVFSTLSSKEFQREAGIEFLEKRGGPASGGPSTTVEFLYRVLDSAKGGPQHSPKSQPQIPNGAGLKALYGALTDTFRRLGGGEAFLKAERSAWGPDPWEKLQAERKQESEKVK